MEGRLHARACEVPNEWVCGHRSAAAAATPVYMWAEGVGLSVEGSFPQMLFLLIGIPFLTFPVAS